MVIAIIAILAAMLMPAISKARAKAEEISCVNNMKGLGTIFMIYTTNNKNWLPPMDYKDNLGMTWIESVMGCTQADYNNNSSHINPALDARSLFCPMANEDSNWTNICYAFNVALGGRVNGSSKDPNKFYKTTNLKYPSKKATIVETTRYSTTAVSPMLGNWRFWGGKWTAISNADPNNNTGWGHPASRHDSRANVVHLDTHVEAFTVVVANPYTGSPFNDMKCMKGDD